MARSPVFVHDDLNVDLDQLPWQAIVRLVMTSPRATLSGSGFLVGKRTVLTAAHNICSSAYVGLGPTTRADRMAAEIKATAAGRGASTAMTRSWIPRQWNGEATRREYDYGLIQLADPIGDAAGHLIFSYRDDAGCAGKQAHIYGFTAPATLGDPPLPMQRRSADIVDQSASPYLFYNAGTEPGMSGSPVFLERDGIETSTAIGIHIVGGGNRILPGSAKHQAALRVPPDRLGPLHRKIMEFEAQ
jgi:V8-like Glu-specific endopeptidase